MSCKQPLRIMPLPRELWTEPEREVLGMLHGADNWETGARFNVMRTLAHHPDLAVPFLSLSRFLLKTSSLSDRHRELVTLRTSHLYRSNYEWTQHLISAHRVGLTMAEIEAIKVGPAAANWSGLDQLLLQAVDELHSDTKISDETWKALTERFNVRELMELVFTVGNYGMMAMFLNCAGVEIEPDYEAAAIKLQKEHLGA